MWVFHNAIIRCEYFIILWFETIEPPKILNYAQNTSFGVNEQKENSYLFRKSVDLKFITKNFHILSMVSIVTIFSSLMVYCHRQIISVVWAMAAHNFNYIPVRGVLLKGFFNIFKILGELKMFWFLTTNFLLQKLKILVLLEVPLLIIFRLKIGIKDKYK